MSPEEQTMLDPVIDILCPVVTNKFELHVDEPCEFFATAQKT
jgi:hypothetical protein